jgi:hypothetical protein
VMIKDGLHVRVRQVRLISGDLLHVEVFGSRVN